MRTLKPFSMSQNEIWKQQQGQKPVGSHSLTPPRRTRRAVSYLGQVGGLADPVDTTEGDHVRTAMALGIHDITENVDAALGLQDLH